MGLITNSIGYESDTAIQDTTGEDIINVAEAWEIAASRSEASIDIVERTTVKKIKGGTLLEPAAADLLTIIVEEVDFRLAAQLSQFIFDSRYSAIQVLSLRPAPKKLPYLPLRMQKEGILYIPKKGITTKDYIQFTAIDEARGHYDELISGLLQKI
jgi:hypothetical protein